MKKRIPGIAFSLLVFVTLQVDYYFTGEFTMEDIFYFGLSLLVFCNIVRKLLIPTTVPVAVIINLVIMATTIFCFGLLLLIGWGNSFQGRGTPIVWVVGFVLNIALAIEALVETGKVVSKLSERQT